MTFSAFPAAREPAESAEFAGARRAALAAEDAAPRALDPDFTSYLRAVTAARVQRAAVRRTVRRFLAWRLRLSPT